MKKFQQLYSSIVFNIKVFAWHIYSYYLKVTILQKWERKHLLRKRLKFYPFGLAFFYFWFSYTDYVFWQSENSMGNGYHMIELEQDWLESNGNEFWDLVIALFLVWHIYFFLSLYFIDWYFYAKKIRYGIFIYCIFFSLYGTTWYWEVMTIYLFQVSYLFWFFYAIVFIAFLLVNFEVEEEESADELLDLQEKANKRNLLKQKENGQNSGFQPNKMTLQDALRVFFATITVEDHIETPAETFARYQEHVRLDKKDKYLYVPRLNGYLYQNWNVQKWWIFEEEEGIWDPVFFRYLYKRKYNHESTNILIKLRNDFIVARYNFLKRKVKTLQSIKTSIKWRIYYFFGPLYQLYILYKNPILLKKPFSVIMGQYEWHNPYTKILNFGRIQSKNYTWTINVETFMNRYMYYSRVKFRLLNRKKNFWFINK